ncbi:hypothetical protein ACT3S9_13835 [Pseudoalteromonas sp. AOP31-A2-14]|uniref:hypothetical protein n=1 Tax=Pseudoalteromonas sp. AOP31-A2-14 TaxID=3457695 RepID=UPI003FBA47F3
MTKPWLSRGINLNVVVGFAAYTNVVTGVSLNKQREQWHIDKFYSMDVVEQSDYTNAIASCTNQVS